MKLRKDSALLQKIAIELRENADEVIFRHAVKKEPTTQSNIKWDYIYYYDEETGKSVFVIEEINGHVLPPLTRDQMQKLYKKKEIARIRFYYKFEGD